MPSDFLIYPDRTVVSAAEDYLMTVPDEWKTVREIAEHVYEPYPALTGWRPPGEVFAADLSVSLLKLVGRGVVMRKKVDSPSGGRKVWAYQINEEGLAKNEGDPAGEPA